MRIMADLPYFRIVTCIDVPASTPEEAYELLRKALRSIPESVVWESSDEWYADDGTQVPVEEIEKARMAVFKKEDEDEDKV